MRHLSYDDLKLKGIPGSKHTVKRKERFGKFPRSSRFGKLDAWLEPVIDAYNEAVAAGCSEEEATAIAERERPSLSAVRS
jgi:hypothetical protein